MITPKCSVLMSVRDTHGPWLRSAIECVMSQSYPNLDLVVCDNGSTKSTTVEILKSASEKYEDSIVLTHETRPGSAYALDACLKAADPDTVYFSKFDSDDLCHRECQANRVRLLERLPDTVAIVYDNFFQLNYHPRPWIQIVMLGPYDYRANMEESLIPGNSTWRASVYDTIKKTFVYDGYEGRANRHAEDYAHWLRITDHFDAYWFDQDPALTWTYRVHHSSKYWSDRKGADYAKAMLQYRARARRGLLKPYDIA